MWRGVEASCDPDWQRSSYLLQKMNAAGFNYEKNQRGQKLIKGMSLPSMCFINAR